MFFSSLLFASEISKEDMEVIKNLDLLSYMEMIDTTSAQEKSKGINIRPGKRIVKRKEVL